MVFGYLTLDKDSKFLQKLWFETKILNFEQRNSFSFQTKTIVQNVDLDKDFELLMEFNFFIVMKVMIFSFEPISHHCFKRILGILTRKTQTTNLWTAFHWKYPLFREHFNVSVIIFFTVSSCFNIATTCHYPTVYIVGILKLNEKEIEQGRKSRSNESSTKYHACMCRPRLKTRLTKR